MFRGTTVSVITDKTTNYRSKSVVNALLVQSAKSESALIQPVLVEVKLGDEVNSAMIYHIVTKMLTTYGIELEDVTGVASDNAAI